MTARGDDRKLMHWVASHGYTVVRASSGHWKVYDNGVLLMATSGTPRTGEAATTSYEI